MKTRVLKKLPKYDFCESNCFKFEVNLESKLSTEEHANNEDGFSAFNDCITELIVECLKVEAGDFKSKQNKIMNPWITNGLIVSINHKDKLYDDWKDTVTKRNKSGIQDLYKNYRTYLKFLINKAKKSYNSKRFENAKGDNKKTWNIINEIRGKQQKNPKSSFILNSKIVEDRRLIANAFNEYSTSITRKLNCSADGKLPIKDLQDFAKFLNKRVNGSIYFDLCSVEEIEVIIKTLGSDKASNIPIKIVKRCSKTLAPYLCKFFNAFIESGTFSVIQKLVL